jgi:hypothetical protein
MLGMDLLLLKDPTLQVQDEANIRMLKQNQNKCNSTPNESSMGHMLNIARPKSTGSTVPVIYIRRELGARVALAGSTVHAAISAEGSKDNIPIRAAIALEKRLVGMGVISGLVGIDERLVHLRGVVAWCCLLGPDI